jgi:hypothetical protein
MPAVLAKQEDENGGVGDGLTSGRLSIATTLDGVRSPRLHGRNFLRRSGC